MTVDDANQLVTDSDGATYTYDQAGRLTQISEADGTVKTYTYDSRGLLVEEKITTPGSGDPDPGDDVCASASPTIVGTEGDDVLNGGSGTQAIFGLGGNDIIDAGSGSDIVCGGDGDDQIIGGTGVDTLVGGEGIDNIDAGPGKDTIYAGQGDDVVDGGGGADTIFGWGGDDTLDGGTGADDIDGEAGTDTIDGGTGSDTCETEPTRVRCEHDLQSSGGGAGGTPEETVIARVYDGDGLLTAITVTHPDQAVDTYNLTWDRTLRVPQIITVTKNGTTTSLIYGSNRAFAVDTTSTTSYQYSVLGDTSSGPHALGGGFDPYGQPDTIDPTTIGFGYRSELQVGTHIYLRFRDHDPQLGRFTTVDPVQGVPGTSTLANAYAYTGNDPVGLLDPLGLKPDDRTLGLATLEPVPSPTDSLACLAPSAVNWCGLQPGPSIWDLESIIEAAANRYLIDPLLLTAIILHEGGGSVLRFGDFTATLTIRLHCRRERLPRWGLLN